MYFTGGRFFVWGEGVGVMLCPTESVTAQAMYDGRNKCYRCRLLLSISVLFITYAIKRKKKNTALLNF
jgi:hypothetical protein